MPVNLSRSILKTLLLVVVLVIAGAALWTWATLTYDYSDGERAGYVQKFSHKGWICKTWEGELALVNLPGAMPEIFKFTVRDESVARQIEAVVGKRVALKYEQHIGVPTSCFGDTEYFVVSLHVIE